MTLDRSAAIMDAIFASPNEEQHVRVLKIFQDFMSSEAAKHSNSEKGKGMSELLLIINVDLPPPAETSKSTGKVVGVQMDELVGNTDGFADSG
jgi:cohesin loading factor subunit SCC2